jgi:hypothetical protein
MATWRLTQGERLALLGGCAGRCSQFRFIVPYGGLSDLPAGG